MLKRLYLKRVLFGQKPRLECFYGIFRKNRHLPAPEPCAFVKMFRDPLGGRFCPKLAVRPADKKHPCGDNASAVHALPAKIRMPRVQWSRMLVCNHALICLNHICRRLREPAILTDEIHTPHFAFSENRTAKFLGR